MTEVSPSPDVGFLGPPAESPDVRRLYDGDVDDLGYVMNLTRVWAHQPALQQGLDDLIAGAVDAAGLTFRQRAVLVVAAASARGDAYCALAWGGRLAAAAGANVAAGVVRGDDSGLDDDERLLASWARVVAVDPNAVAVADVEALRHAGFDDARIAAITTFVGLRLAFSTVNGALGARPDRALIDAVPESVRAAVTFGRPCATADS